MSNYAAPVALFTSADKIDVTVVAEHDTQGNTTPLWFVWPDGRKFAVDKILDVRRAASLKAGGCGMRYTIRVLSHVAMLYCEEGRWFVEKR